MEKVPARQEHPETRELSTQEKLEAIKTKQFALYSELNNLVILSNVEAEEKRNNDLDVKYLQKIENIKGILANVPQNERLPMLEEMMSTTEHMTSGQKVDDETPVFNVSFASKRLTPDTLEIRFSTYHSSEEFGSLSRARDLVYNASENTFIRREEAQERNKQTSDDLIKNLNLLFEEWQKNKYAGNVLGAKIGLENVMRTLPRREFYYAIEKAKKEIPGLKVDRNNDEERVSVVIFEAGNSKIFVKFNHDLNQVKTSE